MEEGEKNIPQLERGKKTATKKEEKIRKRGRWFFCVFDFLT